MISDKRPRVAAEARRGFPKVECTCAPDGSGETWAVSTRGAESDGSGERGMVTSGGAAASVLSADPPGSGGGFWPVPAEASVSEGPSADPSDSVGRIAAASGGSTLSLLNFRENDFKS